MSTLNAFPITPITEMLKSRVPGSENRDVYGSGAIRDVFLAAISGKHTLRELLAMSDKSTIHDFLFGKHLSASGRGGWHWSYTIGEQLADGSLAGIKTTDDRLDKPFQFVNAVPIDAVVNSKFRRGDNVTRADVLAAKSARLAASVESAPIEHADIGDEPATVAESVITAIVEPSTEPATNRKQRRAGKQNATR